MTHNIGKHQWVYASIMLYAALWVVVIYSDIGSHKFLNWDDAVYVLTNPFLQSLSSENIIRMFTDYNLTNWHPLTWLSFSVDLALFGQNAVAMKLVNVLLHVANVTVLFFLYRAILEKVAWPRQETLAGKSTVIFNYSAILASSLFLIHPQHVESVVWVSERKDVLCALFYFATLLCYLKYRVLEQKKYYYLAVLCGVLATLSKPMAVSLPIILMVIDVFVLDKLSDTTGWRQKVKVLLDGKWTFLLLSILVSVMTLLAQAQAIKDFDSIGIASRLVNASIASIHYITTIVNPSTLSPFYPFSDLVLSPDISSILPILILGIIVYGCIFLWKKNIRLYLIALLVFFISVLPVIGIISVGHQAYADRYTYIPCSLFYLALSHSLVEFVFNGKYTLNLRYLVVFALVGLYSIFSFLSMSQVEYWRNDETLWSEVARQYPNQVYLAHQNLGNVYLFQGKYMQSIKQYNIALSLKPDSSISHENLGRVYGQLGDRENEIKQYLLAIEKDGRSVWPKLSAGYFYLAGQKTEKAATHFRNALQLEPNSPPVIVANAKLDLLQNRTEEARNRLVWLLERRSNHADALWVLAQIYVNEGKLESAGKLLERLLMIKPGDEQAKMLLLRIKNKI